MTRFSSNLPPYSGEYGVGAIDLEVPCRPRTVSDITFVSSGDYRPFELETVQFTLYYPTTKDAVSTKACHHSIPRPLSSTGEGYARAASIPSPLTNALFTAALGVVAGGNRIPAHVDVPLCTKTKPWPVVIFSHGLASLGRSYAHFLGEVTSRGYVVAAMEHRDGSAPSGVVHTQDGLKRNVFYLTPDMLSHGGPINRSEFKAAQVAFREAEIEETIAVLRRINEGHGRIIYQQNPLREGSELPEWQDRIDVSNIVISGHSLGATTALRMLKAAPTSALSLAGCFVLDPGKSSGALNEEIKVPLLILHSQSWSEESSMMLGRPHFDVVQDIAHKTLRNGQAAWFMTLPGTAHPSCTDLSVIQPLVLRLATSAELNGRQAIAEYTTVCVDFLQYLNDHRRTGVLACDVTDAAYRGKLPKQASRSMSEHGPLKSHWQIHVSP